MKQFFHLLLVTAATAVFCQQPQVIQSDEFHFIWPIPTTWESTSSLTKAQYAIKTRAGAPMTCTLLAFPAGTLTLSALLEKHANNPKFMFAGIKARYPDSKFVASRTTKLGSQDAILIEAFYTMKNLDQSIEVYACQVSTVHAGMAYSINFECTPNQIEEGKKSMSSVLGAFSFTK
jgi:hypothetical protein